ncbi:MAG: transglycosylase domain-containing protein [Bacteroidales bacterium]|nr:transglycosylase domain-containing protein [Bacteroidales bacterium]
MDIKQIPKPRLYLALVLLPIVLLLAVSFAIRGFILHKAIDSVNARVRSHQYSAHWDGARFRGLNTVYVKGIYIQSRKGGNELFMDSVSVKVRIIPLLVKKIRIREFACRLVSIRYHTEKKSIEKARAKKVDSGGRLDQIKSKDLSEIANRYIRRLFSYTPARTRINRVQVRISSSTDPTLIGIHGLVLNHGKLTANLVFAGGNSRVEVPVDGRFDKASSVIEFHMVKTDTSLFPIPLLQEKYGVSTGFDSLGFMINLDDRHRHLINFKGSFSFAGFVLNGERLATEDIRIDHFTSSFLVGLGPHHVELDSATRADLNTLTLSPYLSVDLENGPTISFRLLPEIWEADDFFGSLPRGMFTSLIGFQAKGQLHHFLDFRVNLAQTDSLYFNTKLWSDDLHIAGYGVDDYRMLNSGFRHQVYERGRLAASFFVGPENPDFVTLEQISPFLRAAVMTSEDGSFFYHHGFNPNAFRESIAINIKKGRFARGGSTISMQLVKNVFLTRNKTLARKIEEAIIVWLIESKNLVSKQRMYEVYLNIIEWGPGVYGINQASRFYFNKSPAELSLPESVYLASIVPQPKWYRYSFTANGVLKPFFGNYFDRLKVLMVKKEFIAPEDTTGIVPEVHLSGPAAMVFTAPDSTVVDSVLLDELKILPSL